MGEVTENTINDLVADYLRRKDLQVTTQYSGHTGQGRQQPDFILRNSGIIFGEGEWQSKFLKGLKQAHDFTNLPGATGSFVLAYPDAMKDAIAKRIRDSTASESALQGFKFRGLMLIKGARAELFYGPIDEAAEWIRDGVQHRPRKEDAGAFVTLMRDIVEELSGYLPTSGDYPTFFEHIIATMPKHAGELDTAKRAAAYLLLNQVVFYRILSKEKYPSLDPSLLESPGDLHAHFFERVLEDDYAAIFSSNVASLFPGRSLPFIRDLISYVNLIQPESFTRDLLGSIFHELIPGKVRKSVAAFYTNPEAARLLAKLTIDDPSATVADFACGSGTLLMAAYERKAELLIDAVTEADHKRFLEHEITGCDIMPFAAHLAVVQLALRQPSFLTDKVRIAVQDSTTLKPGTWISPLQSSLPQGQSNLHIFEEDNLAKHKIKRGAISGQGKGHSFKLEKLDAVLMNPPFTRKQLIGKDYRKLLTSHFPDYATYESKEQSLFGYFVFLADRFLKPGGRMGFVLPATSIRQMSSEGMRQLIRDRYDLEYLILSGHRMAFSEDAMFNEILLVARKRTAKSKPGGTFVLATVRQKPTLDNMARFVSMLKDTLSSSEPRTVGNGVISNEFLSYRTGSRKELDSVDWLSLLPGEEKIGVDLSSGRLFNSLQGVVGEGGIIQGIRFEGSSDYVNVKNTLVSSKRPVGTRLNWVIVDENPDSTRARSQTSGAEIEIPKRVLRPACRSPAGLLTMEITEPPDFAVGGRFEGDGPFWNDSDPDAVVSKRIDHFKSREGRLLIAGRNHIDLVSEGTHFLAFCSREPLIPTWSFWSVRVNDSDDAKILCLWLNSIFAITHLYDIRIVGTGIYVGWLKADLLKLPVPDLSRLPVSLRREMLSLFDELGRTPFPSLLEQFKTRTPGRMMLDRTVASALGLDHLAADDEMLQLYDLVVEKLEALRETHSG
jgi:tRNA1(Val) A37 N6-methylase TrmN6